MTRRSERVQNISARPGETEVLTNPLNMSPGETREFSFLIHVCVWEVFRRHIFYGKRPNLKPKFTFRWKNSPLFALPD